MAKVRWLIGMSMVGLFLTAAVVYLSPSNPARSAKRISLEPSQGEVVLLPQDTDKLRIAVGAIISPAQSLFFYENIFDYIGETLGQGVEMVQQKTYAEVNLLMKEGHIDAAFVCSRPYVQGHRDFGMEILCVPVCFGKTEYCSYFIVHRDSSIQNLEQLRGKMFAFSDPLSNSGKLIPTYTLAKLGERPESFFRKSFFTYSHDNSIRLVAEKFVDGAAVDSLIWEYLDTKEQKWTGQTRVIYKSDACAIPPVVVSPGINHELKEKLRSAFLNMHSDPEGRRILKTVLIDRFTVIEDSAYESIRQMEAFMKDFESRK